MKISKGNLKSFTRVGYFLIAFSILLACEDFVKVDPPTTDLIRSTVFEDETTANAAIIDVYSAMSRVGFASGNTSSVTFLGTLLSDEQQYFSAVPLNVEFFNNEIIPTNSIVLDLWSQMYKTIYKTNAILEGVQNSNKLSSETISQLDGEAKFIRAFCYFYLVNLFGDVPLVLSTNYQQNSLLGRAPSKDVYTQIIRDLKDAQVSLPDTYTRYNNERVRANSAAATALLARTYLHLGQWVDTEEECTKLIDNNTLYSLKQDLDQVFAKNSSEAILQFHNTFYPLEYLTFRVFSFGAPNGSFYPDFIDNFEVDDVRRSKWVRSQLVGSTLHYYPGKYKNTITESEYSTLFRLAEIYLIRAEANAQLNQIEESLLDLNIIRNRAGLNDYETSDKESLLSAIEQERKVELFTEQGLRWFDLKRLQKADEILGQLKPDTWQPTDVLLPIPEIQILTNPSMRNAQNPGY